jgi:signal transduction histidine kinase
MIQAGELMARQRGALLDAGVLALAVLDAWLRAATEGSGLVVSLVAALALILRRRGPLLAFVFTLPALFTIGLLVAPFVALYTVAERSRPRGAVLSCAVVAGVGDFLPWPPTHFHLDEVLSHGLDLIDSVVYVGASVALGVLVRTRRELSARLAELTAARERQRQLESRSLLARERARLAREMHDVVSHQVSLIAVQAGALRVTARDVTVRETADVIRKLSVGTLEELRDMVRVLRAAGGHGTELAPQPRLRDIHDLVEKAGQNARVVSDAVDGRRWPDPVERAAYRTVQEALTNVNKHAPDAAVTVQVTPWGAGLCVAVRNGPPPALPPAIDLPGGGHGLMGLRERAELLGGAVRAGPTQDGGFVVEALFPNDSRTERDPDR